MKKAAGSATGFDFQPLPDDLARMFEERGPDQEFDTIFVRGLDEDEDEDD
jgi:hypothetical protein